MIQKIGVKKWIQVSMLLAMLIVILGYAMHCNRMQQQVWNAATLPAAKHKILMNPRVDYMVDPVGIDDSDITFSWEPGVVQRAYEIIVSETGKDKAIVWDSGIVFSAETIQIPYMGRPLEDNTKYDYMVHVFDENDTMYYSETAFFETSYVCGDVFEDAKLISMNPEENIYENGQAVYYTTFEKKDKELAKATFYGSALGVYDAWMNGSRIGNDELKPGWTDYNDMLLYNTYDITELIGESNTIAAMAGTGWWCGRNGFGTYGYHQPAFICKIVLEYEDGEKQMITTDERWHYTKDTAVRSADFFNGETYDQRLLSTRDISMDAGLVLQGSEKDVHISTDFTGEYQSYYAYNVKHVQPRDRNAVTGYVYDGITEDGTDFGNVNIVQSYENDIFPVQLKKGETLIVDLGQNMTGVPYVSYDAPPAAQIDIQFAEMLNDSGEAARGNDGAKGTLYRANYRSATTQVRVVTAGGEESYKPTFFYTGFRYLSLTADQDITVNDLKGLFIGNSAPVTGSFSTDHEKLNRLWQNAAWSQANNYMLVATDCPQRDERIGWMGDLCSFADTSMYMSDLYGFYDKWMTDVKQAQTTEGAYTDTVPATITTGSGNGGWAEAGILIPLSVYRKYGDKDLMEEQYVSMQAYMDYLASISSFKPEDLRMGPLTTYGDWLAAQYSDPALISALWYQADAVAMEEVARILGKDADARRYQKLHTQINDYILETYAHKMPWNRADEVQTENEITASLSMLSQTEMLFLLKYSALTDEQKQLIVAELKQNIEQNDYKVMTGFAGTPILLPVLTEHGMVQTAYRILLCEENPSWLYSVNQGATTIWERYDSYTQENGFADAAMNSFNHFNEGSVAQWMYESMLGIRVDLSKEQPITICPVLPSDDVPITTVSGTYQSVYGKIALSWETHPDKTVTVRLTIPENTKAKVILPIEGMEEMTIEGGTYEWNGKYKLLE